jgi:hypothetical protein
MIHLIFGGFENSGKILRECGARQNFGAAGSSRLRGQVSLHVREKRHNAQIGMRLA